MNICEFIQEKVAVGEINDDVSAHLRICHECKAFADDLDRFLSCDLPEVEPPKRIDDAIRAAAAETALANRFLSCDLPEVEPPKRIDDAIRAAAAEAAAANRLLSCALPDAGEPPKHVDDAIRAAAARAASAFLRKGRMAKAFRVLIPVAAALAVCFLFYFDPMGKPQQLAVPTQVTAAGDWTGAVMDGELTKVSMEVTSSLSDLSLSDTDLLIAQLEADFAAYAEN
ncbi:MAG: hypothetical protein IKQ16_09770 [Lentisphaeria bacterium]|nr:hypothetical protein [Lentisphaeria bacterium]